MTDRRLMNRYARVLGVRIPAMDRLAGAIHTLLQSGGSGDPFLLSRALELLFKQMGATQTTLVMVAGASVETRWWYPEREDEQAPVPIPSFCEWLLEHPDRTLVIRDMETGPHTKNLTEPSSIPYRAAVGCALRQGDGIRALLFAYFKHPRPFHQVEFTLLEAVAGFMARVLEIEDLKQSLHRLEDALAITQAVMEDSSTRDPETDLPNLRYLEIWQKAMLGAQHRPERLVVAECQVPLRTKKDASRVRKAAEGVRAGDLVVRVAPGRFMVIFQHTPRSIAHILLLRLRMQLGGAPMGATLWIPGPEGLGFESCRPRLEAALEESRLMEQPALVWHLPEGIVPEPPPRTGIPPVLPKGPQLWQPPVLRGT